MKKKVKALTKEQQIAKAKKAARKTTPGLLLRQEQEQQAVKDKRLAKVKAEEERLAAVAAQELARQEAQAKKAKEAEARLQAAAEAEAAKKIALEKQKAMEVLAAKKAEYDAMIERLKKEALEAHYAELKAKEDVPKHPNWKRLTLKARQYLEQSTEHRQDLLKRMDEPNFLEDTEKAARDAKKVVSGEVLIEQVPATDE